MIPMPFPYSIENSSPNLKVMFLDAIPFLKGDQFTKLKWYFFPCSYCYIDRGIYWNSLVSVRIWMVLSPSSVMLNFSFLQWNSLSQHMELKNREMTRESSQKSQLTQPEWWAPRTKEYPSSPSRCDSFCHKTPGYNSPPGNNCFGLVQKTLTIESQYNL